VEARRELSLTAGDVVVYASHGVGRVALRREQSVVLEFATSGLSVILPIERAFARVRPLSTEAELAAVGQTLGGAELDVHSNWQHRLKTAKAKLAGGEAVGLAEVIRDASRREERTSARNEPGKLSLTERQLCLKARQLLADEIGASRGVDAAHANEWIAEQLSANAHTDRVPERRKPARFSTPLEAVEASGRRARRRRP
jgi:RNA polymerase-interacting CarD/CdnL/TRCF family regulator